LNPVFHLDEKYSGEQDPPLFLSYLVTNLRNSTGQSPADKIAKVREEMKQKKAKAVVVTMLDEVAWLFNLRGSDIDYNPGE
jgi:Xaa-Pro aminopeptidase